MAVGDSLGLPVEGLSPRGLSGDQWRQSFVGGWGITSDDTQHAVITFQAIYEAGRHPEKFRKVIGRKLAVWFLCLPPGIGFATLRACLKLCLGFRAPRSGVRSAGNGPAMRATIIGWEIEDDKILEELVEISTCTTHTDPRALTGARAVAWTMREFRKDSSISRNCLLKMWQNLAPGDKEWQTAVSAVRDSHSVEDLLARTHQKKGVGGYIYHTVPVCLYIAEKERSNFEAAVVEALGAGGDTDTCASIVAALSAASGGVPPEPWLKVIDLPTGSESIVWRFGMNLFSISVILVWHIPRRLFNR